MNKARGIRSFTPNERAQMVEMHTAGNVSLNAIGKQFNAFRAVVRKIVLEEGVVTRPRLSAEEVLRRRSLRQKRDCEKHGKSNTPEYRNWASMIVRCHNEKSTNYPYYGGKGIRVCDEWRRSFNSFLNDVGKKPTPKHTIDRIDNSRGYEPGNVRWATRQEQSINRTNNHLLTHQGVTLSLAEWSRQTGLGQRMLWKRFRRGWPAEKILAPKMRGQNGLTARQSKQIYYAMIRRCEDALSEDYPNYGGRGIAVCDRWLGPDGLKNFLADMGVRPSQHHSIDRIDNDGNYSPENCQWSDRKSQARNTRKNRLVSCNGETICLSAWAEKSSVPAWLIAQRIDRGWDTARAIFSPVRVAKGTTQTPETELAVVNAYRRLRSLVKVGRECDLSKGAVKRILDKNGEPTMPHGWAGIERTSSQCSAHSG